MFAAAGAAAKALKPGGGAAGGTEEGGVQAAIAYGDYADLGYFPYIARL